MGSSLPKKLRSAFDSNLSLSLLAGFITSLVGVALFGIVHACLIVPIWSSLPAGVPLALIGGGAIGWAFHELHASGKLSLTVRGGAVFGLSLWLMLIPMTLLAVLLNELRVRGFLQGWRNLEEIIEFLLAAATGALVGWLLTRSRRVAGALGAAMLAVMLVMGRPIIVTEGGQAPALFGAFLLLYVVCGIGLVIARSRIIKIRERRRQKAALSASDLAAIINEPGRSSM